jgi:hypothetical protein
VWSKTALSRCSGLHRAVGLRGIRHLDDSSIDVHTLRESTDELPTVLLERLGVRGEEIATLKEMFARPR